MSKPDEEMKGWISARSQYAALPGHVYILWTVVLMLLGLVLGLLWPDQWKIWATIVMAAGGAIVFHFLLSRIRKRRRGSQA